MARCPDCNKFVGYELGDPEIQDDRVDEDNGEWEVEVRVVLECAECGLELKEYNTVLSGDVYHDDCAREDDNGEYKLEKGESEEDIPDVRYTIDAEPDVEFDSPRKGQYRVRVSGDITCKWCGEQIAFEADETITPSEFEDLTA